MAEKKRNDIIPLAVRAAIFKQTPNTYYEMNLKTGENKFSCNIVTNYNKELTLSYSTPANPNPNPNPLSDRSASLLNLKELRNDERNIINPSRMLIYEDSNSEEEEDEDKDFRNTPPNIQERIKFYEPRAPMKSRKEFEKKVLRPKKLVYNDHKENDNNNNINNNNEDEDLNNKNTIIQLENNNRFYHSTPINPRKIIIPIINDDNDGDDCPNDEQSSGIPTAAVTGESSRTAGGGDCEQPDRNKSRNDKGNRKKKKNHEKGRKIVINKSTNSFKIDSNCNKENNALQIIHGIENNEELIRSAADSTAFIKNNKSNSIFVNKNYNRNNIKDELTINNSSKTHFRI